MAVERAGSSGTGAAHGGDGGGKEAKVSPASLGAWGQVSRLAVGVQDRPWLPGVSLLSGQRGQPLVFRGADDVPCLEKHLYEEVCDVSAMLPHRGVLWVELCPLRNVCRTLTRRTSGHGLICKQGHGRRSKLI